MTTNLSEELLQCLFAAMQRDNETMIYFNQQTQDVAQEVQGYLSSFLTNDQRMENTKLANRIMNGEPHDEIVVGIHHLIPRLALKSFLNSFRTYEQLLPGLNEFINEFEDIILKEYQTYVRDFDDIAFSVEVEQALIRELENWNKGNHENAMKLRKALIATQNSIAADYIKSLS